MTLESLYAKMDEGKATQPVLVDLPLDVGQAYSDREHADGADTYNPVVVKEEEVPATEVVDISKPGFEKSKVGDVVKIEAVDWGYVAQEVSGKSDFDMTYGTVYGQVVGCSDSIITVAFQVFRQGNVRCVLSIPWVTVTRITVLEHTD